MSLGTSDSGITAPMNINAVLAHLVKMSPKQRQQFAQNHADDPLMLSAAKYVDNQIKDQAKEYMAQQNGAPPKVNQQVVASMAPPQPQQQQAQAQPQPQPRPQQMAQTTLPENSGIAQLPVPNIQKMAGGGIVAFADGGFNNELFRKFLDSIGKTTAEFANADPATKKGLLDAFGKATSGPQLPVGSTVPTAAATPAVPGQSYAQMMESNPTMASRALNATRAGIANPMGAGIAATGGALSALGTNYLNRLGDEGLDTMSNAGGGDDTALAAAAVREGRNNPTPPAPAKPGDYRGSKAVPYAGESVQAFSPSAAALRGGASTQASQATRPGSGPASQATRPGSGPARLPSQPAQSQQGLAALQASLMPKGNVVDPDAEAHELMASKEKVQGQLENADALQRQAGLAEILAPKEQRIKDREDRVQKTEDLSTKMAVINAGLAMMQSTGKGLAGIAEGAAVGTKQYAEGMKASEAARQKMEDARDAFEEFRYNAGNMSQKDVTASKRAIMAGENAAAQVGINAKTLERARLQGQADKLFSAIVQANEGAADRASRERTAAISAQVQKEIAQMPGAAERMYATFGGGDAKKGFEYFTAATAEGKGAEAIMQLVLKTPGVLETLSPELRKAVETEAMKRFAPGTVPGKAVPAAQARAP